MRSRAFGSFGERVDAASAGVGTVQDPIPIPFPFLAPGEGAGAGNADLGGEIRFLHGEHSGSGELVGVCTVSGAMSLKTAVGSSTDFTDFKDGLERGAAPLRCFHVSRRVKRQPLSTGFQSVESVQSVDPAAISRRMDPVAESRESARVESRGTTRPVAIQGMWGRMPAWGILRGLLALLPAACGCRVPRLPGLRRRGMGSGIDDDGSGCPCPASAGSWDHERGILGVGGDGCPWLVGMGARCFHEPGPSGFRPGQHRGAGDL